MNENGFLDRLSHTRDELSLLLKEVSHDRIRTIKEAVELLDYLGLLHDVFDDLWNELSNNWARHVETLARFPDEKPYRDLVAIIVALNAVAKFLRLCPKSAITAGRPYSLCARRPHHRAGRDGRMAPPGAEQKNDTKQEGKIPSDQIP
jgi:hypothetical protein